MVTADLDPVAYTTAVAERERRLRQVAAAGLVAVVAAILVGVLCHLPQEVFVTVAGVLGLGVLAARLALWRCPACKARLPGRSGSRVCPGCDRPLPPTDT